MEPAIENAVREVTDALSFLPGWAVAAIVLALALVASLAVHWLLGRLTRRAFAHRPGVVSLIAQTRALTRLAFVIIALALVLPALDLPPRAAGLFATALPFCFVVLIGWIALTAVDIGVSVYLMRYRLDADDNLLARKHVTQMRVLKRVISTIVILITAGAALMTIGAVRQVGVSLFASAGVAGLAVGLAARPVLANLIAGIQLAMTQPIRIEDAVIVENEMGFIEEITSTFVVVRLWDQRRLVVPLSYFMEKPFQNWTREGAALLGTVLLYLDYTAPIDRIRAKASEIAAQSKFWDRHVIGVQVTDAKERTIEVRVLVSGANAGDVFDLRCEMREKLITFLRDEFPDALPRMRGELTLHQAEAAADGMANRADPEPAIPLPPRAATGRR